MFGAAWRTPSHPQPGIRLPRWSISAACSADSRIRSGSGELCVCDLTELLGLPQSSVSRHLAYLRRARLVETEQKGKFAHYRLSPSRSAVHRNLLHCVRISFPRIPALRRERARAARKVLARALEPC
jgi:DNA-binding transcriptional ArsR family regulator